MLKHFLINRRNTHSNRSNFKEQKYQHIHAQQMQQTATHYTERKYIYLLTESATFHILFVLSHSSQDVQINITWTMCFFPDCQNNCQVTTKPHLIFLIPFILHCTNIRNDSCNIFLKREKRGIAGSHN